MGAMTVNAETPPAVLSLPRGVTLPRLAAVGGLCALGLLYVGSFPVGSDALILSDDGLNYAAQIQLGNRRGLFHPHHLLYHGIGILAVGAGSAFTARAWDAALLGLRSLSALSGALAVCFVFLALRRLTEDRFAAFVGAASLAATSGFWYYASVPESMAPAAAAMAGALWALAGAAKGTPARAYALAGLWHAAATLLRQDQILFAPAILAHAFVAGRQEGRRRAAAYLAGYALPVALVYLLVYAFAVRGDPAYRSLWHWLTYYGQLGIWGQGGRSAGWSLSIVAERYLRGIAILPLEGALLPGALSLAFLATAIRGGEGPPIRAWWALAGAWVGAALLFYAWWDPSNAFAYMMGSLVPTAMALGLLAARTRGIAHAEFRRYQQVLVASLVPALLWITVTGLVRPLRAATYHLEASVWYAATRPEDVVLTNRYPLALALRYTMSRNALWLRGLPLTFFGGMDAQGIAAMVARTQAAGGAVYVTQDVLEGRMVLNDFARAADGFEQSYPAGEINGIVWQVLGRYHPEWVHLGEGPRGPVGAWRLLPKREGR